MSSDLLKILRSLKGSSSHHEQRGHNDHYGNYRDVNHLYDNHYESLGKHFFSGLALKAVRELSGKILQNKRLALLAIIVFLTIYRYLAGFCRLACGHAHQVVYASYQRLGQERPQGCR
jgi:hypothetical protein